MYEISHRRTVPGHIVSKAIQGKLVSQHKQTSAAVPQLSSRPVMIQ